MPFVVGIFPNPAAVSKLSDAVKAAGLDLADLIVIADEVPDNSLITSGVQFKLSGEPDASTLNSSRGIITSSGGTEVPGLAGTSMPSVVGDTAVDELLSDLNIPDARTEDYADALEAGRCVAGYPADDVDKVKAIFVAAGANPIEVF